MSRVTALVPTAAAAALLAKEFPLAELSVDGTLFTVVIAGASYRDAVARIKSWMEAEHVEPVLVTDDETVEELLFERAVESHSRRRRRLR